MKSKEKELFFAGFTLIIIHMYDFKLDVSVVKHSLNKMMSNSDHRSLNFYQQFVKCLGTKSDMYHSHVFIYR